VQIEVWFLEIEPGEQTTVTDVIVGVADVVLPPPPPPQAVSRREIERARSVERLNSAAGTAFTSGRDTHIRSPQEHVIEYRGAGCRVPHPSSAFARRVGNHRFQSTR
jgi:hypothetical protein